MLFSDKQALLKQILAVSSLNFGQFNIGLTLGYSAVSIPQLRTELHTTESEIAIIASCICIGQIIGSIFSAFISHRFGRKLNMIVSSLFLIPGWSLIYWGNGVYWIIIGRIGTGIGCGIEGSIHSLYVCEIVSTKRRGPFASSGNLIIALGVVGIYLIGSIWTWRTSALVCGISSLLSLLAQCFLPESPYWLKQNQKMDKAENMLHQLGITLEEFESRNTPKQEVKASLLKRCLSYRFLKPLGILIFAFWTQSWCGFICILSYAVTIMNESGVQLNEYHAALTVGVVHLLASGLGIYGLHQFKRRTLLLTSTALCALLSLCLFLEKHLNTKNSWIPYILILAFILVYANGLGSIPWVLLGELFPVDVSAFGVGLTTCVAYGFMFLAIQSFPWMKRLFGLSIIFLIYGIFGSFGGSILYFLVPETKGLHLDEIEEMLNSKKDKIKNDSEVVDTISTGKVNIAFEDA
ncbi:uncharacterized protein [Lepeophtheirus salmonis]|uniref:uncharacterized protein isoform X1 n=1 Tax=Lepeophtheirus salmonis TaxID=72036 RepID=UPI001AE5C6E8|nr:sugar transporter ERD6-like 18 isoform X1 [Lepeophtheirus salmonis]